MLKHHTLKGCTKFEVSSISCSGDILGRNKNFNGSHPFQGRFVLGRLGLAMSKLCTKFEISMFTHYEDMKDDKKYRISGSLGSIKVICNIAM